MKEASQLDWARLAAFVDGEGHINIKDAPYTTKRGEPRNYHVLSLNVTNSSILLMRWLQNTFGGHIAEAPRKNAPSHWKVCYRWWVHSANAGYAIEHLLPYLIVKREQADVALALRATVSKRGANVIRDAQGHILGHKDIDVDVLNKRAELKTKLMEINSRRGVVNG